MRSPETAGKQPPQPAPESQVGSRQTQPFADRRTTTALQRKLKQAAENSPQVQQLQRMQAPMLPPQQGGGVIQRKPADWAHSPKMVAILQHQPGYFSTWKQIKAGIEAYKLLRVDHYGLRHEALENLTRLIEAWRKGHEKDNSPRVEGIRASLPDLEELIEHEQEEVKLMHEAHHYKTGNTPYTSLTRPDLSFTVVKTGNKLKILSENAGLSGHIEYVLNGKEIELKHFEAAPEGLGLGSVLMNEFAVFALDMGAVIVDVQAPAFSAMGAYAIFGGLPRVKNQAAYEHRRGQYEQVMGLRAVQGWGEQIPRGHDDETYHNFIHEEAKAIGNSTANRAQFDNPNLSAWQLGKVRRKAMYAHIKNNKRNVANVKRAAHLKALSGFLSYNVADLLNKTAVMRNKKWKMG